MKQRRSAPRSASARSRQALGDVSGNSTRKHKRRSPSPRTAPKRRKVEQQQAYPSPPPTAAIQPATQSSPSPTLIDTVQRWLQNTVSPTPTTHKQRPDTMPKKTKSETSSRKRSVREMDGTLEQTPRPPKRPQKLAQLDGPPPSLSSVQLSRLSRRSTSPVKQMADMRLLSTPVIFKQFDGPNEEAPMALEEMQRKVVRISHGIGVIPESCRDEIVARSQHDRGFRAIDGDLAFRPDDGGAGGPCPSAERVAHLLKHARACYEQQYSEASWNCIVHAPLLDLALCGCGYRASFQNCTTAKIQPKDLVPITLGTGSATESKMVDFAITLDPDSVLLSAMRTMAARHPALTPSVNQTFDPPLRNTPIAVSIETKRTGAGLDNALVQVGVWAAAQWKRLGQMVADTAAAAAPALAPAPAAGEGGGGGQAQGTEALDTLPFLPLLVVQGHD